MNSTTQFKCTIKHLDFQEVEGMKEIFNAPEAEVIILVEDIITKSEDVDMDMGEEGDPE